MGEKQRWEHAHGWLKLEGAQKTEKKVLTHMEHTRSQPDRRGARMHGHSRGGPFA